MDVVASPQLDLFADAWPQGLRYRPDFLSPAEEQMLLEQISTLHFEQARYKAYRARRRIVSYGGSYDYDDNRLLPADPLPEFLQPLRQRAAAELGVAPSRLQHALLSEYPPRTPLGWHRDVHAFEAVIGISLLAACVMRFRPYPPTTGRARPALALELAPRSLYVIEGAARWHWQHRIDPTPALRYSVTLRTLARSAGAGL
jgi:alkylated DNA repair dioxygenase AlkB